MDKIIECVPNFSEGQRMGIIKAIAESITSVKGVVLLHTDPSYDANRTVFTFAGNPKAVLEAAFLAAQKATELIDMRVHQGKHPRIGSLDVCPFVPIKGVTMEEVVTYAREFAQRLGRELDIPVFCYENATFFDERKNLANCRKGEYEGLPQKLEHPDWKPDFGPQIFNAKTGASIVGAREILIAYNINLNTKSIEIAREIASAIRESGTIKNNGSKKTQIPGSLKAVKAIGWFMEKYGCVQVSTNLINYHITPIHTVFEEVKKIATTYRVEVTGSELIGLAPLDVMLEAGKYFLTQQGLPVNVSENAILEYAVKFLGLSDKKSFNAKARIIEYVLEAKMNESELS